jgi:hypothetical protein
VPGHTKASQRNGIQGASLFQVGVSHFIMLENIKSRHQQLSVWVVSVQHIVSEVKLSFIAVGSMKICSPGKSQ